MHLFSTGGAPPADVYSLRTPLRLAAKGGLYLGLTIFTHKIGAVSTCTSSCTGIMIVAQKVHATAVTAGVDSTTIQLYARAKPSRCGHSHYRHLLEGLRHKLDIMHQHVQAISYLREAVLLCCIYAVPGAYVPGIGSLLRNGFPVI